MPWKHTTQESNLDFFKTLCLLLPLWNQWAISHLQAAAASKACAHTHLLTTALTGNVLFQPKWLQWAQRSLPWIKAETNMPRAPKNPMVVISGLVSALPAFRTVFALLPSALICFSIWKDSSRNGACISALWLLPSLFYSPAPGEGRWATSKGFAWNRFPGTASCLGFQLIMLYFLPPCFALFFQGTPFQSPNVYHFSPSPDQKSPCALCSKQLLEVLPCSASSTPSLPETPPPGPL